MNRIELERKKLVDQCLTSLTKAEDDVKYYNGAIAGINTLAERLLDVEGTEPGGSSQEEGTDGTESAEANQPS